MDYRQYYLAKEWVKLGHEVTILGAGYSHLRIHQPVVPKDLATEMFDGIQYIWLKTMEYRSSGVKRILNMLTFIFKSLYYNKKIARRVSPDAVLVSSTYVLDIYPAYLIAKKCRTKLVYELHDLWPLSPMIIGDYSKYHPLIWMVQRAENFACRNCDYYVSVLGNAKEYLVRHGLESGKFVYIPNGYSEDDLDTAPVPVPAEHEKLFQKLESESSIIVGYAGSHAPSNALASLIAAAKMISVDLKVAFVLVGDGSQKTELMKIAEKQNPDNIFFLPAVLKAAIPSLLSRCDLLYAGGVSSILHSYGTSFNKVTDYMLAGKPIIFAVDDPKSLVEQVGCGLQIPAENAGEIATAIGYLCNLSTAERLAMGIKGREYAEKELRYSSIAQKILEAIHVH
jgi:glycosyltransferase involved in cell wall biosynthesis